MGLIRGLQWLLQGAFPVAAALFSADLWVPRLGSPSKEGAILFVGWVVLSAFWRICLAAIGAGLAIAEKSEAKQ